MCEQVRVKVFIRHHLNTAIRLSGKLCDHEAGSDERARQEHIMFIHLNAARRAKKLWKYGKRDK